MQVIYETNTYVRVPYEKSNFDLWLHVIDQYVHCSCPPTRWIWSVLFFLPYVFTSAIVGGNRFRNGEQNLGLNSDLIYITQQQSYQPSTQEIRYNCYLYHALTLPN